MRVGNCILNRYAHIRLAHLGQNGPAADEVAVDAFLKEQIKFTDIAKLIYTVLKGAPHTSGDATLNQALDADAWAREAAQACLADKTYKKASI